MASPAISDRHAQLVLPRGQVKIHMQEHAFLNYLLVGCGIKSLVDSHTLVPEHPSIRRKDGSIDHHVKFLVSTRDVLGRQAVWIN